MKPSLPKGTLVTWQAITHAQRMAQLRYTGPWIIAEAQAHTHLAGEVTVLVQPPYRAHEARRVMVDRIRLVPEVPAESIAIAA